MKSPLPMRMDTTSKGWSSSQPAIFVKIERTVPAFRREQLVWQKKTVPFA